jgi:hypothetical protein
VSPSTAFAAAVREFSLDDAVAGFPRATLSVPHAARAGESAV